MTAQKKKIPEKVIFSIYIFITIAILVGAVAFSIAREKGYSIKGFSIQKTSTLQFEVSEPDTWVFIAEKPIRQTIVDREMLIIPDVKPERQLITVIKNGYFPWAKRIQIPSNSELTLYPFLLKQDVKAHLLTYEDPDFLKTYKHFSEQTYTPQTSYETTSHRISADKNSISVECLNKDCNLPAIETVVPVTSVYQFRNNPNVVVYSTPTEIYVSELIDDLRISYKIFEGQDIKFFSEGDSLFVQSKWQYFKIQF